MPSSPAPGAAPVFIVGPGRSGTSLLRRLLNTHPDVYVAQETGFFLSALGLRRGADDREKLGRFLRSYHARWLRLDDAWVERAYRDSADDLNETYRRILRSLAERAGARRYGDKIPGGELMLERLLADFPDARILYIARHPVALVASKRNMPFTSGSCLMIALSLRMTAQRLAGFSDERVTYVRIEDLLADIPGTYRKVLAHIGVEPDPGAGPDPSEAPPPDTTGFEKPFPWLTSANSPVRSAGAAAREPLSPAMTRLIERVAAPYMKRHGYRPTPLESEPARAARLGAAVRDLPVLLAFLGRAIHRLLVFRFRWRRMTPEREQRLALSINPRGYAGDTDWEPPPPPR